MEFAIYVINCDEGTVKGTNDVEDAKQFIDNDQYIVLHAHSGTYFLGSTKENSVEELETTEEENNNEEEDK